MFRTGEFSHLARVSKRLLQFYDEIGLLKPARMDLQTGYRYYSAKQLPRLNRILALKELGFSLDQITQMLQAEISDEAIQGMLLLKKAEVEQTVLEALQRLRSIEARLQQNRMGDDALDVVVKSIPAQRFLSVRATLRSPEELLQLLHLVQRVLPSSIDQRTLGPLAGVVYTDGFTLRNNDVELGYLLKKPVQSPLMLADAYELRMRELPAAQAMASAVQTGGPDLVFTALGRIGHWASAIPVSHGLPEIPALPGAEVGARVCSAAVPGFGEIRETFTSYDEHAMRFAYEAIEGRPWFIKHAENHWMVHPLGPSTAEVEARAEVEVSWFPGVFLAPLLKLQLSRVGVQTFEELKYYVERDQVHPRKLKAQQKHGQKA